MNNSNSTPVDGSRVTVASNEVENQANQAPNSIQTAVTPVPPESSISLAGLSIAPSPVVPSSSAPAETGSVTSNPSDPNAIICIICMGTITDLATAVPCGHFFDSPCVERWVTSNQGTCPLCRVTLTGLTGSDGATRQIVTAPEVSASLPDPEVPVIPMPVRRPPRRRNRRNKFCRRCGGQRSAMQRRGLVGTNGRRLDGHGVHVPSGAARTTVPRRVPRRRHRRRPRRSALDSIFEL